MINSLESMPKGRCVVVITELIVDYTHIQKINSITRDRRCGFIVSLNLGLGGIVFVDYGDRFCI